MNDTMPITPVTETVPESLPDGTIRSEPAVGIPNVINPPPEERKPKCDPDLLIKGSTREFINLHPTNKTARMLITNLTGLFPPDELTTAEQLIDFVRFNYDHPASLDGFPTVAEWKNWQEHRRILEQAQQVQAPLLIVGVQYRLQESGRCDYRINQEARAQISISNNDLHMIWQEWEPPNFHEFMDRVRGHLRDCLRDGNYQHTEWTRNPLHNMPQGLEVHEMDMNPDDEDNEIEVNYVDNAIQLEGVVHTWLTQHHPQILR